MKGTLYPRRINGNECTPIIINKDKFIFGRSRRCDVRIYDEGVRKMHCALSCDETGVVVIEPLQHLAVTYVNNVKITSKVFLSNDDVISIFSTMFRFACSLTSTDEVVQNQCSSSLALSQNKFAREKRIEKLIIHDFSLYKPVGFETILDFPSLKSSTNSAKVFHSIFKIMRGLYTSSNVSVKLDQDLIQSLEEHFNCSKDLICQGIFLLFKQTKIRSFNNFKSLTWSEVSSKTAGLESNSPAISSKLSVCYNKTSNEVVELPKICNEINFDKNRMENLLSFPSKLAEQDDFENADMMMKSNKFDEVSSDEMKYTTEEQEHQLNKDEVNLSPLEPFEDNENSLRYCHGALATANSSNEKENTESNFEVVIDSERKSENKVQHAIKPETLCASAVEDTENVEDVKKQNVKKNTRKGVQRKKKPTAKSKTLEQTPEVKNKQDEGRKILQELQESPFRRITRSVTKNLASMSTNFSKL